MLSKITSSSEETIQLGIQLGKQLPENSIVCLFGDLAAGKTTLIKGLVQGATGLDPDLVNSPTFIYLNIYEAENKKKTVYHFDLYRLHSPDEFLSVGFDEFFFANGICCIEWSERIQEILPEEHLSIFLYHLEEDKREIIIDNKKNNLHLNLK